MKKTFPFIICVLLPITLLCALAGLAFGSTNIFAAESDTAMLILLNLRLPRVLASILCGVGLSVSGVLLQSVTGNALAAPNIIGVNAGAGFFCIVMLTFLPHLSYVLPFGAFLGAFLTSLLIVGIANKINSFKGTVILAGIAITALFNAFISLLSMLDSDVLSSYNAFSIGGLRGVRTEQLYIPAVIILACLVISLIFSRQIHTLCLGDSISSALGVRVKFIRTVCIICASASAASAVSFAGLLGFVGLVVPHVARRLFGERTSVLLVTSSFIGASTVCIADLFGRVILAPTEIPVGIIMSLIGAPFFFILLLKRRDTDA